MFTREHSSRFLDCFIISLLQKKFTLNPSHLTDEMMSALNSRRYLYLGREQKPWNTKAVERYGKCGLSDL